MKLFNRENFDIPNRKEWDAIAKDIVQNQFQLRNEIITVCLKALRLMQNLEDQGLSDQRITYIRDRAKSLKWVHDNEDILIAKFKIVELGSGRKG